MKESTSLKPFSLSKAIKEAAMEIITHYIDGNSSWIIILTPSNKINDKHYHLIQKLLDYSKLRINFMTFRIGTSPNRQSVYSNNSNSKNLIGNLSKC